MCSTFESGSIQLVWMKVIMKHFSKYKFLITNRKVKLGDKYANNRSE